MRKLLEEVMQIDGDAAATQPVEPTVPEITPELIASLVEQMPELADVDQVEFEKGLKVEMEHLDTVGGDMLIVAKIAADHIKETPEGKSYYDALEAMEHELQEAPEEEESEHLPGEEESGLETPAGEAPVEEPPMESKKLDEGKKKKKKVDEQKPALEATPEVTPEATPEVTPAVETATNEEAQEMVDKGEATIPSEAVVENPEQAKE